MTRPARNNATSGWRRPDTSLQGSLVVPGNVGGMNWSGYAFDPEHNLLIGNRKGALEGAAASQRTRDGDDVPSDTNGKQYVVIDSTDTVTAFALP